MGKRRRASGMNLYECSPGGGEAYIVRGSE